jgi:hypothetical protein
MKNFKWTCLFLMLIGCSGNATDADAEAPVACSAHSARQFQSGNVACKPGVSDTCAFGVHNQPTQLDQSGEPLAYYCACNAASKYTCWSAPSLAKADPLPAE